MFRAAWMGSFVTALLTACFSDADGQGTDDPDIELVGECEAPRGAAALSATPIRIGYSEHCLRDATAGLSIVTSVAEWDAVFMPCGEVPDVPPELDLSAARGAIAHVDCSPIEYRFGAETADEIIIGVTTQISGACLPNLIVVPLPRSTKPARLAQCREQCTRCPPVPVGAR